VAECNDSRRFVEAPVPVKSPVTWHSAPARPFWGSQCRSGLQPGDIQMSCGAYTPAAGSWSTTSASSSGSSRRGTRHPMSSRGALPDLHRRGIAMKPAATLRPSPSSASGQGHTAQPGQACPDDRWPSISQDLTATARSNVLVGHRSLMSPPEDCESCSKETVIGWWIVSRAGGAGAPGRRTRRRGSRPVPNWAAAKSPQVNQSN
jgi:hypothetical protein